MGLVLFNGNQSHKFVLHELSYCALSTDVSANGYTHFLRFRWGWRPMNSRLFTHHVIVVEIGRRHLPHGCRCVAIGGARRGCRATHNIFYSISCEMFYWAGEKRSQLEFPTVDVKTTVGNTFHKPNGKSFRDRSFNMPAILFRLFLHRNGKVWP